MSQVYDWAQQLDIVLAQIKELEDNYQNKVKGKVYAKRQEQLNSKLRYIKHKFMVLGTDTTILKCNYIKGRKVYDMYLTDISILEAKAIVKFRDPGATHIKVDFLNCGIPSISK